MESKREPYYLGIDLNDDYAMISYYQQNMSEPDTVSTIAGGQMYHVPTLLARRKNMGMWYYGEEAKKMAKTSEVICVDALLKRAVNGEKIGIGDENYEASDLLALFLRKMIDLPLKLGNGGHIDDAAAVLAIGGGAQQGQGVVQALISFGIQHGDVLLISVI